MKRVAIVGMGFMGRVHFDVYTKKLKENVEVAALCDSNRNALDIEGSEAVEKFTDYNEMLERGGFDFVDVCLPTHLHAPVTVTAMKRGYHVFCEKPLAGNFADMEVIVETTEQTGMLFGVGQCLRYWPAYVEVKKLIEGGSLGKVRYAEFARFSQPPVWTSNKWVFDGKKSGNAALDLHIHDVDMILYMFGKPKSVFSKGVFENDKSISHIVTTYNYGDKVIQATGGWICTKSFGFNMRAFFILERGSIELDFSKEKTVTVYPEGKEMYPLELAKEDGYYYELKTFVEAVEKKDPSRIVMPKEAAESVKLCLREIESAKEGKELDVL